MKRREFIAGALAAVITWALRLKDGGSALAQQNEMDDTAQIQAALDRGGKITLEPGRRYKVSAPSGTRSALVIRSDTTLDLAGSTLELLPNQHYCNLISSPWGQLSQNICIANGELIGNGALQPSQIDPLYGISPTLYFPNVNGLVIRDVLMRDTYMYAVHAKGEDGTLDNVSVNGAVGGGIWLSGDRWKIDRVNVRNVAYFDSVNCTGNPLIVTLRNSTVGDIRCENYAYGVKFQDGCENVTVNSIVAIGGLNHDLKGDFLVKIQGMKDTRGERPNLGIQIRNLVARGGRGVGLYIYFSREITISSYLGENNGRIWHEDQKYGADVLLIEASSIRFNTLHINQYNRYGVWLHDGVNGVSVGTLKIENPKSVDAIPIVNNSAPNSLSITSNP